ncbi:hypothetical protein HUT16_10420 [Kitasatospora sp. NA04385]|nr:hypothetical protein [Kitasatospora sp. NA04385]QKW19431.1 hypothetical protein HUT16_10420 [Kitasatospora sp. NA04385]
MPPVCRDPLTPGPLGPGTGAPWTPAASSFLAAAPGVHAELVGLLRRV